MFGNDDCGKFKIETAQRSTEESVKSEEVEALAAHPGYRTLWPILAGTSLVDMRAECVQF